MERTDGQTIKILESPSRKERRREIESKYLATRLTSEFQRKLLVENSHAIVQGYIYAGPEDDRPNRVRIWKEKTGNEINYFQEVTAISKAGEIDADRGSRRISLSEEQFDLLSPATDKNDNGNVVAASIRIRKSTIRKLGLNKYTQTIKGIRAAGMSRTEEESEITQEQYEQLLPTAGEKIAHKIRYIVPIGNKKVETDLYEDGHIVLEVEFRSLEEQDSFTLPGDIGETINVTDIDAYKNKRIVLRHGFPDDPVPTTRYKETPEGVIGV